MSSGRRAIARTPTASRPARGGGSTPCSETSEPERSGGPELALAEPGALITPKLLSNRIASIVEPIVRNTKVGDTLKENLNRIEARPIRHTLESLGGRRSATARKLGVTREGLYK
jgi:DNA-binding NtrC family response regulator